MSSPTIKVLRPGDTSKPDPFTIAIISNPVLERPWRSGLFVVDPITSDVAAFDTTAALIEESLFGLLPGQAEQLLSDPSIVQKIRVVSVFVSVLEEEDANSLVGEDDPEVSTTLVPRRARYAPLLAQFGIIADVAYAVSKSPTHRRASAYFTSDDDSSPGMPFAVDSVPMVHRDRFLIPGTVAIHTTASPLTPLHEFGHAASSYTNGMVVDLYVDSAPALNCRSGRPIPVAFGTYDATSFTSDTTRDSLTYPLGWQSYHCELIDPAFPAVMDDYKAASSPVSCQEDAITRLFLLERVRSKTRR
jgi:hypothetical protein